ncbi:MAG: hypothetical protein JRH16_04375 [Deltaproteobacteria bacterium]|nr:hypothetical protein [Deltaproteobacteria bacterium]MBW2363060.1 hypothetical protein [Deltaproteobacteria bacterium]
MWVEGLLVCAGLVALLAARRVWVGYPPPPAHVRVLGRREFGFLTAAADTVFPPGGAISASGSDAEVAERTDVWIGEVAPFLRVLMRLLFFLVEHATLFFPAPGRRGFRRFSSLDAAQREAVMSGWAESSLGPRRLVFESLRAVLTMSYLSDPAVLRELGVAPRDIEPGYCEADLLFPPIGHGPDAIRIEPEDLRDVEAPATLACDAPLDPRYAAPRA